MPRRKAPNDPTLTFRRTWENQKGFIEGLVEFAHAHGFLLLKYPPNPSVHPWDITREHSTSRQHVLNLWHAHCKAAQRFPLTVVAQKMPAGHMVVRFSTPKTMPWRIINAPLMGLSQGFVNKKEKMRGTARPDPRLLLNCLEVSDRYDYKGLSVESLRATLVILTAPEVQNFLLTGRHLTLRKTED